MNTAVQSLKRGCVQLVRRPMYLLMIVVMPLLCAWFMLDLMDSGSISRVPVGIVDLDNSLLSRNLTRNLDGMNQVDIIRNYPNFAEARQAVQRGEIMGFFFIPSDLEQRALGGRQPTLSYYANFMYYAPASMQYKGFKTISVLSNGAIVMNVMRTAGLPPAQITATLMPYPTHVHMPGNPWTNYDYYLSASFVPCYLALFILLVTAFAIGSEFKTGLCRNWLSNSGNSIVLALAGKLLPQTALFTAVGWMVQWLMYRAYGLPLNCNPWHMIAAMPLFVAANQGFAVTMMCVTPNFRYGTTLCTLLGMLSFSFCGFSLPQESMYPWVETLGFIMPSKYFFLLSTDQALNGIALYFSRYYYAMLAAFVLLPLPLVWRLKRECLHPVYVP